MRKRWIVMLALILIIALAVFTMAAETETDTQTLVDVTYHCVCGDPTSTGNPCADGGHEKVEWTAWTETNVAPYLPGYWYLPDDITLDGDNKYNYSAIPFSSTTALVGRDADGNVTEGADVYVDLNGKTITGIDTERVYRLEQTTCSLTITDSAGGGMITNSCTSGTNQGMLVWMRDAVNTLNIYGGTLDASGVKITAHGAAINNEYGGIVNMYGGTIKGGIASSKNGGALYTSGGTINILGGKIYGYTAASAATNGGAIYAAGAANITIKNAEIHGGKASNAGAIYLAGTAKLTIEKATIYAGNATAGAIKAQDTASITMIDATIDGNNAGVTQAGCVFLEGSSTMTMSGDSLITNGYCSNSDSYGKGAGVMLNSSASLTMSGNAKITGNKTNSANGGGVHLNATTCTLTVSENAQITGNTNKNGASNVYMLSGDTIVIGDDGLDSTARIGVTSASTTMPVQITTANAPHGVFASDSSAYETIVLADGVYLVEAGASNDYSCICGADNRENGVHTQGCYYVLDSVWEAWTETDSLPTESGYYYLNEKVTVSAEVVIAESNHVVIDLNGNTITQGTADTRLFRLNQANAELTITDRSEAGNGVLIPVSDTSENKYGMIVDITKATATLNLYGGTLDATDKTSKYGVAINNWNGTVNMCGGTITGGTSKSGGGGGNVMVYQGTFNMLGGTISDGTATITGANYGGGNVRIGDAAGTFNMYGGTISGGTVQNGGGIYVVGTLNVNGGTITGGTTTNGGAIYNRGTVVVNGGMINGGTATYGGSVYVNGGTLNINGGTINGGAATYGGSVYANSGTLNINGGTINGGTATQGGAVFVKGGTNTMNGGTINAGTISGDGFGGAVAVSGGTFTMNGGVINATGKSAPHGAAVGLWNGTFVLNDGEIIGGTSTGSGGGAVSVIGSGGTGTLTMNGGTIRNGIHKGNDSATMGGGNIRVNASGVFTMTGGTITGGSIDSAKTSANGGGVLAVSGAKITIAGDAKITGNTDASGKACNLYLPDSMTITVGEMSEDAKIGVTMAVPGVFTGETEEAYLVCFTSDNTAYYVQFNADSCLELTSDPSGAAVVDNTCFSTVQAAVDAISDSSTQYVKVLDDSTETVEVSGSIYMDLNGKKISTVNIAEGAILSVFDSATSDYDCSNGYGKITVNDASRLNAQFVTPDALTGSQHRYIAINENGAYSFHRIYLGVDYVVLYPASTAINYKVCLLGDQVVADNVSEYGVMAYVEQNGEKSDVQYGVVKRGDENFNVSAYGSEKNENTLSVRIVQILNETLEPDAQKLRAEDTQIISCAYIKLKDNSEVTSSASAKTLKDVVLATDELVQKGLELTANQEWALYHMYTTYQELMEPWFADIENPAIPGLDASEYIVHCLCGDSSSTDNPCAEAGHIQLAWKPWDGTSNITEGGNYYLTADVEHYQLWLGEVSGTNGYTVNIDLNGHNFTATSGQRAFGIGSNTTVNLTNSSTEGGVITGKYVDETGIGGAILAQTGSVLSLYPNVTVTTDGASVKQGGAIYTTGTLNVYGATVIGADLSGVSSSAGGAIYAKSSASITLKNATVYGGKSANAAAIYITDSSSLKLSGTTVVYGGTASNGGGAIKVEGSTKVVMTDNAQIIGGTATNNGGCLFLDGTSSMAMSGNAKISGGVTTNTSTYGKGAGVMMNSSASLSLTENAQITGNESKSGHGGGVHLAATGCKLTVSGSAKITGNTNASGTSNAYLVSGAYVTVGDLTEGASIGISMADGSGKFTTASNATEANAAYFSADNEYCAVKVGTDGLYIAADVSVYSVGYGEASIDPVDENGKLYSVGLLGYGNEDTRIATSIETDLGLLATCLAVADAEGDTVLMISVDAAAVSESDCNTAKNRISAATGVPVANIMISANHQHSTPKFTSDYKITFYKGVVAAAEAAMKNLSEVDGVSTSTVDTSTATTGFNFVRNITLYYDGKAVGTWSDNHDDRTYSSGSIHSGNYYNYNTSDYDNYIFALIAEKCDTYTICSTVAEAQATSGYAMVYESVVDSDMQLVKFTFKDTNVTPVIVANFQVHPHLAGSSDSTVVTSDVVGAFRNAMEKTASANVMYFSGASGDVNPTSKIGDEDYEKEDHVNYGNALAALVAENANYETVSTGSVAVAAATVEYASSTNGELSDEAIAAATQIAKGDISYDSDTHKALGIYSTYHATRIYQRTLSTWTETRKLNISVFSIGDIAFVAAPYEMFSTNGMQIKTGITTEDGILDEDDNAITMSNPFKMTMIATQANGAGGYLPSALGWENGGYSTDITYFAEGTAEKLVVDYLTLLNSLNN